MTAQKHIYISGPMTGVALHNFPRFLEAIPVCAQDYLDRTGHFPRIYCPAYRDLEEGINPFLSLEDNGTTYDKVMSRDLHEIRERTDCVYFLPGWDKSKGARREMQAAMAGGCEVHFLVYWAGALRVLDVLDPTAHFED